MTISDAQFSAWLLQNGPRVVLAEIDYVAEVSGAPATQTLYFSTAPTFVSAATDTPASTPYQDRILQLPTYTRQLDRATLGGRYSIGFGSLTLNNADGALDAILAYAYDGSQVRFYLGDPSWAKADFRLVFTALGAALTAPDFSTIEVQIRDASASLNRAFDTGVTVGGTGQNAATMAPANLGRVMNVECILKDALALTYVYADVGTNTTVLAVRDRGVDLAGGWTDHGDGTLTLSANPQGQITADVLRVASGTNTDSWRLSDVFGELIGTYAGLTALGQYGGLHASFTADDAEDFHSGISIRDNSQLADLATALADSGNGFWASGRDAKIYLGRIRAANPPGAPKLALVEDDLIQSGGIKIDEVIPLYSQVQAQGNRNWMPQTDLGASLAADVATSYRRDGFTFTQAAPTGTTYTANPGLYHKSMAKSPLFSTYIVREDDSNAATELATWCDVRRRQTLPWMQLVDVVCHMRAYALDLGDVVTLTMPRFAFASGPAMQVVGIAVDLNSFTVALTLAYRQAATGVLTPGYLLQLNGSRILIGKPGGETLDPAKIGANTTLSAGNLSIGCTSPGYADARSTTSKSSGKYYFEWIFDSWWNSWSAVGVCQDNGSYGDFGSGSSTPNGWGWARLLYTPPTVEQCYVVTPASRTAIYNPTLPLSTGDVGMLAVDLDAGKLWFGLNGAWKGASGGLLVTGDPASGSAPFLTDTFGNVCIAVHLVNDAATFRFGASSWQYAAPAGFGEWTAATQSSVGDIRLAA